MPTLEKKKKKGTVCHMAALLKPSERKNGPPTPVAMTITIFTERHIMVKKHTI